MTSYNKKWTEEDRKEMLEYVELETGLKGKKLSEVVKSMEKLSLTIEEAVQLYEDDRKSDTVSKPVKTEKVVEKPQEKAKVEPKPKATKTDCRGEILAQLMELFVEQSPNQLKNGEMELIGSDGDRYIIKVSKPRK